MDGCLMHSREARRCGPLQVRSWAWMDWSGSVSMKTNGLTDDVGSKSSHEGFQTFTLPCLVHVRVVVLNFISPKT